MEFPRTLVIGIDGATFDLIKPWAEAGLLPTFAHLLKHGAHATLDAFPHLNSAAAWTNIITGYNPAQHGIYNFTVQEQDRSALHLTTGHDRAKPAFWHTLAAAGQRVGVMNVPISFPAEKTGAFMVSGMDTPDTNLRGFTYPEGIFQELHRAGIEYAVDVPTLGQLVNSGITTVPPIVRDMTTARTQAFLALLEKYPCDLAMLVYIASDRMSHYFWQQTPPLPDAPEWSALRDLYQLYDRELETLLEQAGSETTIFILSDHGFGLSGRALFGMPALLQHLGYLVRKSNPGRAGWLGSLLRFGRRTVPLNWQHRLANRFPNTHAQALRADKRADIDWSRTRAEASFGGGLKLNTRGRSAEGIVSDDEYAELCAELARVVQDLTDADTGKSIVTSVHQRDEYYHGPYLNFAPDVLTRWNQNTLGHSIAYRQNGHDFVVYPRATQNKWAGTHAPEGIFIAYGKGIRGGIAHPPISHYELVPTLLYLHDQPIADDMDGRALTDWFDPTFTAHHILKTSAAATYARATETLTAAEQELVESRLRQLGYLE